MLNLAMLRVLLTISNATRFSTVKLCFGVCFRRLSHTVRECVKKSAACAASPGYVRFQAVIKSAASAASLHGGRARGRLDHGFLLAIFGRASSQKIIKISDSG